VAPQTTPLHIAARFNHVDTMKELLNNCNANAKDQWGFTPLHYAVASRHKEVSTNIKIILYVPKLDYSRVAVKAVLALLEYGSIAGAESLNHTTPLELARALGYEELAVLLCRLLIFLFYPFHPCLYPGYSCVQDFERSRSKYA
jgi:ankyrin repeat protein